MASSEESSSSASETRGSDSFLDSDESSVEENDAGIKPYMFEPKFKAGEVPVEEVNEIEGASSRLANTDWCSCENCQVMATERECLCCSSSECQPTMAKLADNVYLFGKNARFGCMTNHPGFQAVCLNPFVLSVAWLQYKQVYDNAYEGPQHKKYRHIAYRQYVRWVHGYVGRNIRVVIPSCVVCCIKAHFPPPGNEEYHSFTGFKLPAL